MNGQLFDTYVTRALWLCQPETDAQGGLTLAAAKTDAFDMGDHLIDASLSPCWKHSGQALYISASCILPQITLHSTYVPCTAPVNMALGYSAVLSKRGTSTAFHQMLHRICGGSKRPVLKLPCKFDNIIYSTICSGCTFTACFLADNRPSAFQHKQSDLHSPILSTSPSLSQTPIFPTTCITPS